MSTAGVFAQGPPPRHYQPYALRAARAEQIVERIRQTLAEEAPGAEVMVDRQRNAIVISGDAAANRLAQQLIELLDRPPVAASPAAAPAERLARGYRPADGDLPGLEAKLRTEFNGKSEVRILADPNTGQVIVLGPAEAQRRAAELAAPQAPGSVPGDHHRLTHLSPSQLQAALQRVFGARIAVENGPAGGAKIVASGPAGGEQVMFIDAQRGQVKFQGPPNTQRIWRQVVSALDRKRSSTAEVTQFTHLRKAAPETVRQAVKLLQSMPRDAAGDAASVVRLGSRRPKFVAANIFQRPEDDAAAQQDAQQPDPDAQPEDAAPDDDEGGLIGPVDIQFIEGTDIIIIIGNERDVAKVEALIKEIEDQVKGTQPTVEVVPLSHVNDEALAELLQSIYTEILEPRQGQVSIRPLITPNALLLVGRQEAMDVIKDVIAKLDQPSDPETQFNIIKLRHISATDAAARVDAVFSGGATQGAIPGVVQGAQPGGAAGQQTSGAGLSPRVLVVPDYRSGTLIVRASPGDMDRVRRIIAEIDVDETPAQNEVRIFPLKNSLASDLAVVLQDAINWQVTGQQRPFTGTGGAGAQQQQFQQGGGQLQQGTSITLPSKSLQFLMYDRESGELLRSAIMTEVRITADSNSNSLVVTAPARSMELIAKLIEQLDDLPEAEAQIKVFMIENGDATNMTAMLQQLFGQTITAGQGAFGQALNQALRQTGNIQTGAAGGESSLIPLRFAVDYRTNSIIATGSLGDLNVVEILITRLDEGGYETRTVEVHRLKNAPALDVATAITQYLNTQRQVVNNQLTALGVGSPFEQIDREVIVVPELVTNSLIISASPGYREAVMRIIEQLDYKPPMVMVEVLIAEVDLNDVFEFGVELGLQDSLLFDRSGISTGTLTPGFNFNNAALGNSGDAISLGTRELLAGSALSSFGLGRSSSNTGYGGLVLSAANESINILIRALEQQGRMQVLSRPSIMTLDNQEAFVQVGADVPRITDSQLTPQGGTTNSTTDVPTGLILRIRPRINQDNMVVMEIDADKSAVGPINEGIPIAVTADGQVVNSPQIERTTAQTTIQAYSGQTVVFAGLITRNRSVVERGVPFLSKLPLLGQLFRFDSDTEGRSELLIIMTPHVINDEADMDALNLTESDRMSWCLADVVEMSGMRGLSGGNGLWGPPHGPATIYPDLDPSGTESIGPPPLMTAPDDESIMTPMTPLKSSRRVRPPQNADAALYWPPRPMAAPNAPPLQARRAGPPIANYGPPPPPRLSPPGPQFGAAPAVYQEPPAQQYPVRPIQYPQSLPPVR